VYRMAVHTKPIPLHDGVDDPCAIRCCSCRLVCDRDGSITMARVRDDVVFRGCDTFTNGTTRPYKSDWIFSRVRGRVYGGSTVHGKDGQTRA